MKKYILLFLISTFLINGCVAGGPAKKPLPPQPRQLAKEPSEAALPWEKETNFKQAQSAAKAFKLMAIYKATLPDPILYERYNISLAADYLKGAVVNPGEVFSLNNRLGRRTPERGFKLGPMYKNGKIDQTVGGGVCKIASVIFNTAVLANQEIVERHPHSMTVPYVPAGQDATISFNSKDFKFKNISGHPILIWSQNTGGTLSIAFYGSVKPPRVVWTHQTLKTEEPATQYEKDPKLPKGKQEIVFPGIKGESVHSWIIITDHQGKKLTKDQGVITYRSSPKIIATGE